MDRGDEGVDPQPPEHDPEDICPDCNGEGHIKGIRCPMCKGTGVVRD